MRKHLSFILAILLCMTQLTGCSFKSPFGRKVKAINKLTVGFVRSVDDAQINAIAAQFKTQLKSEMLKQGYEVYGVDVTIGSTYEAIGRGLASGKCDIGFIPGGTYVLYEDYCDVILTATRKGLSIESSDPRVWNQNAPTEEADKEVTFYRSLLVAGPSAGGRALAEKVNNGDKLTWEELNVLNWGVMNSSSSAGYIYPSLWLKARYNRRINNLKNVTQVDTYSTAFRGLADQRFDIICIYADARRDFEERWNTEFKQTGSIWDDTSVIGVTSGIYNDTICVSNMSNNINEEVKAALKKAFINMGQSEEGKQLISIYNHSGYIEADPIDYEPERAARDINNIRD
ncbi:MAG: PhnD/SsuA/transferrin family substrate-binding protein [Butyrivibrio sp.]|nr:PhnD/SsuA/transferrin family substrate-binding protein [Butyrivibrio sp.]